MSRLSSPRPRYYLSLGDSLAAGVQPTGNPSDMFRTDDGYADQLFGLMQPLIPGLVLVKLGCPGESTASMIDGGICPYRGGSQLADAVAFLDAHRGDVAFVTLDIGFNDFAGDDVSAIPPGLESIACNLPRILAAIRAAAGPDVPLAGMTIYNPFLAEWLDGPAGRDRARLSTAAAIGPLNSLLTDLYRTAGAEVADVVGAFRTDDFGRQASGPDGVLVPLNVGRICELTWMCAPPPLGPDRHANRAGYAAIAGAFEAALLPLLGAE